MLPPEDLHGYNDYHHDFIMGMRAVAKGVFGALG